MFEISKTEHLEAKRLGNEECATILLTDGNASTNIQVNPFLDFMSVKEEKSWSGKVEVSRKVNMLRLATLLRGNNLIPGLFKRNTFLQTRLLLQTARNHLQTTKGS